MVEHQLVSNLPLLCTIKCCTQVVLTKSSDMLSKNTLGIKKVRGHIQYEIDGVVLEVKVMYIVKWASLSLYIVVILWPLDILYIIWVGVTWGTKWHYMWCKMKEFWLTLFSHLVNGGQNEYVIVYLWTFLMKNSLTDVLKVSIKNDCGLYRGVHWKPVSECNYSSL